MANNPFDFMKDVLATPLGELIASVGAGMGEAQSALDEGSLAQTLAIYNSENGDELVKLLREIGYQPNFYTIPEMNVEAQVAIALSLNDAYSTGGSVAQKSNLSKTKIYASPSNASHNNRYNLNVNAHSKINFKIVPVPPPGEAGEIRVVPDLVGLTLAEAEDILRQLGLRYNLIGDDPGETGWETGFDINDTGASPIIYAQTPEAGSVTKSTDEMELWI